uniref:DUF614 protein n=1 Tax=Branchiostoma belcheri tsingtauense TaxID=155462 RepID=Q6J0S6_BRABE|nr:DUF614 protein [Branchiostoma belcheri tsingtauense]
MADFKHGLLGCFDNCGICIIGYFLPCVLAGQNAEKVGLGSCCMCGFLSLFVIPTVFIVARTREETRHIYSIEGTFLNGCLLTFFCPFCVMVQTAQELDEGVGAQIIIRQ